LNTHALGFIGPWNLRANFVASLERQSERGLSSCLGLSHHNLRNLFAIDADTLGGWVWLRLGLFGAILDYGIRGIPLDFAGVALHFGIQLFSVFDS
jgi:hypothetical protein